MAELLPPAERYRCPGEPYTIGRAEHLGRLAAFYEKCRDCPHREDAATLAPRRRRQLAAVAARLPDALEFGTESVAGVLINELSSFAAENLAARFGLALRRPPFDETSPTVALAYDGRPQGIELLAPLARGLRWAACDVVHLGAASVGRLAAAALNDDLTGAVYLGNETARAATASLKFWGPGWAPWSAPGHLDLIRGVADERGNRPSRQVGNQTRRAADTDYLSRLQPLVRNLPPLRVVCDIRNAPLAQDLAAFLESSACHLRHQPLPSPQTRSRQHGAARRARSSDTWFAAGEADFGIVVDGDGESLKVFDDQAQPVDAAALVVLFAERLASGGKKPLVLTESPLPAPALASLERIGVATRSLGTVERPATRQEVHTALVESNAELAGGPSGRFPFGGSLAPVDALVTFAHLLALAGADKRPLAARLKATLARTQVAG